VLTLDGPYTAAPKRTSGAAKQDAGGWTVQSEWTRRTRNLVLKSVEFMVRFLATVMGSRILNRMHRSVVVVSVSVVIRLTLSLPVVHWLPPCRVVWLGTPFWRTCPFVAIHTLSLRPLPFLHTHRLRYAGHFDPRPGRDEYHGTTFSISRGLWPPPSV
jgi:hypothetical protein